MNSNGSNDGKDLQKLGDFAAEIWPNSILNSFYAWYFLKLLSIVFNGITLKSFPLSVIIKTTDDNN